MPLRKFTASHAHKILSNLIELGTVVPGELTAVARDEDHHLQVVVTVAPYDGPLRIHPDTLARIESLGDPASAQPHLTPLQQSILEALSNATEAKPVKVSVLWVRLGRKGTPSGSFRSLLADLVRFGLVAHRRGAGYWAVPQNNGCA